jgi:hypothetical protein
VKPEVEIRVHPNRERGLKNAAVDHYHQRCGSSPRGGTTDVS